MVGSELEFYLLRETYEEAYRKGYRELTPSVPYILDYHILASTYDEPIHSCDGFAMNVIEHPFRCAISFAPFL